MKLVLVCGANGQLGREINNIKEQYPDLNFLFTDIDELDITNPTEIDSYFSSKNISTIINCAAYTAVDKAEDEQLSAEKINSLAVKHLARAAKKHESEMIHISTDYVFDGKSYLPYKEEDATNPQSVYGNTKLEGEKHFTESGVNGIIIRTSWLYSIFGKNFIKTILNFSKTKEEIKVVFDQVGTPTNAHDLAKVILEIISQNKNLGQTENNKVYHFSNEGVCSWYDLAKEIIDYSNSNCNVKPVESHEFPTKVNRPAYSVMNKSLIKKDFNVLIPHWKDSLHYCLDQLL